MSAFRSAHAALSADCTCGLRHSGQRDGLWLPSLSFLTCGDALQFSQQVAHRYGINAYATPVLHLRRACEGGLFDGYADSFEQVRRLSRPVPSQPPEE